MNGITFLLDTGVLCHAFFKIFTFDREALIGVFYMPWDVTPYKAAEGSAHSLLLLANEDIEIQRGQGLSARWSLVDMLS